MMIHDAGNSAEQQLVASPKRLSRFSGSLGKYQPSTAVDVPYSAAGSSLSGSRNPSLLFNERGSPSPQGKDARSRPRPFPGALKGGSSLGGQAAAAGGAQASASLEAVDAVEAALLKRLQEVRSMRTEILLANPREGPALTSLASKLKGMFEGQAPAPRVGRRVVSFTVAEELESVLGLDKLRKDVLCPSRSMDPTHDHQDAAQDQTKAIPFAGSTWPSHGRTGPRPRPRPALSRSSASPRNGSVAFLSDYQRRAPDQDPSYHRDDPRKPSPADASELLRSALHRSSLLVPAHAQSHSASSKISSNSARSTRAPSRLARSSVEPIPNWSGNPSGSAPSSPAMDPARRHRKEGSAAREVSNPQVPSRSVPFHASGMQGSRGSSNGRASKQSVQLGSVGSDTVHCVSHVIHVSSISQLQTVSHSAKGSSIIRGSSRIAPAPGTSISGISQGARQAPGSMLDLKPASRGPFGRLMKALSACFPFVKGRGAGGKESKARPLPRHRTLTIVYPTGA